VSWKDDIATNRVELEDFAKKAVNDTEFKALIKYCFLIATDAKLLVMDRHSIPIPTTFTHTPNNDDTANMRSLKNKDKVLAGQVQEAENEHREADKSALKKLNEL
jgi:hypothetical protein